MTYIEKANELKHQWWEKSLARAVAREVLKELENNDGDPDRIEYWKQVKEELE